MKVRCLDVEYQEGSFGLVQGVKRGSPDRYSKAGHFQSRGNGWGQNTTKSDMLLAIESDEIQGRINSVSLGDFFKGGWSRLTKDRQIAIINTIPEFINVKENSYASGKIYYSANLRELNLWFQRAEADIIRMKKSRANMKREIAANQARKQRDLRPLSLFDNE